MHDTNIMYHEAGEDIETAVKLFFWVEQLVIAISQHFLLDYLIADSIEYVNMKLILFAEDINRTGVDYSAETG